LKSANEEIESITKSMVRSLRWSISLERNNVMPAKQLRARGKHRPANKEARPKRTRKFRASADGIGRELIRAAMKEMKGMGPVSKKLSIDGAESRRNHNGAKQASFDHPTRQFEEAVQRYVDLYEYAPIGYVSFYRVGRIEEINLAAIQLLGRPRHRLLGSPFAVFVAKADSDIFLHHLLHCRSAKHSTETELHLQTPDGRTIPVQLTSVPIHSLMRDGTLLYQTAIVDLTARKRTEEAIRQSELRYRTLFDFVPVAVYSCDAKGLIQDFNQRAVELWGRKPKKNDPGEKFCGSFKMFYPDGRPMPHEKCPMARALRGEKFETGDLEVLVEGKNGVRRNVLVSPTAVKDSRGKIVGAINCFYDITERHQTGKALQQSEERYRAIVSQSVAGMARADLQGRLKFVNQRLCEMLGYTEAELVGKTIRSLTHRDDRAENMKLFQRMLDKGKPYELEKRFIRKDGSILWSSVSASPVPDEAGKTRSAVAVIIDISDRKKVQAELEDTRSLLELRVHEQTEELHAANRELKMEIKRRKGLEGQILEVSDREQQRLGVELHDGLCQHLTAIAFMARATGMRLKNHRVIEPEDIEKIAELVNEAANDARNLARALHHVDVDSSSLVPALEDLVDREIWRTPCRLEIAPRFHIENDKAAAHLFRIAREAVINANKHAQAREIVVSLKRIPKEIILGVSDDGIGIPARLSQSQGMGFHIMKQRAKSMGGRLEVKSGKRGGTSVECHLPC
jgi:PAS domain S-box-containing protein